MTLISDTIKDILAIAVHAPSGDNSQPWKFTVRDNRIRLYNLPDRDLTLYNFRQRGSFVAHGAVIENISIASPAFGYRAQIELFPDGADPNCTAAVTLEEAPRTEDPLRAFIPRRSTNRKPYAARPLAPEHRSELLSTEREAGFGAVTLVDNREQVRSLANVISLNERLILENRAIHDFLFSTIRWTSEEELARPGLYIKTLELAPPQEMMFRLFKHWSLVRRLNKIGLSRFLPTQSAKVYAASSAIGVITIQGDTDEDFVRAGRLFQRMWLKATRTGLSVQPVTAIAYLAQRVFTGETKDLSPAHAELIVAADKKIRNTFGVGRDTIAMVFRTGYGGEPSARSVKLPPEVAFEE